eukprot:TRINITY_DN7327_c0_g1_i2.p1 TRINITY_DN7327_c0_g1~~TRINITY_DN7327_c0_g1_i2.p1  ORF type:complete len:267 (-),score=42.75 TRINITY_DN7327_c0_g1_i2:174-974(-)
MGYSREVGFDEDTIREILANLKKKEANPRKYQLDPLSHYIRCRKTLVVWVIEVCEVLGLSNTTAFHATNLMDRVFESPDLNQRARKQQFQLIAMCCILIAAKFNEIEEKLPSMHDLNELAAGTYTVDLFRRLELSMLTFLKWEVTCVTPACYLKHYLNKSATGVAQIDSTVHRVVVLLLGLALQDETYICVPPSLLCAAAIHCARALVRQLAGGYCLNMDVWSYELQSITGYSVQDEAMVVENFLEDEPRINFTDSPPTPNCLHSS